MYGRKACQLVKELASCESGQLSAYNTDLFDQVIRECSTHHVELQTLIRKFQDEGLDTQATKNPDHFGALIHHIALVRNKRYLMAYTVLDDIGEVLLSDKSANLAPHSIHFLKRTDVEPFRAYAPEHLLNRGRRRCWSTF
ncbi:hypothetical protein QQ045_029418 [Rhodiola kirilowii]